jgi:uncharacterized protein YjiS (DUF1127 family)
MEYLASRRSGLYGGSVRPQNLIGRVFTMLSLHYSRRSLERMDDALLRDIGITREEAYREARRPIWDVPASWRA